MEDYTRPLNRSGVLYADRWVVWPDGSFSLQRVRTREGQEHTAWTVEHTGETVIIGNPGINGLTMWDTEAAAIRHSIGLYNKQVDRLNTTLRGIEQRYKELPAAGQEAEGHHVAESDTMPGGQSADMESYTPVRIRGRRVEKDNE